MGCVMCDYVAPGFDFVKERGIDLCGSFFGMPGMFWPGESEVIAKNQNLLYGVVLIWSVFFCRGFF